MFCLRSDDSKIHKYALHIFPGPILFTTKAETKQYKELMGYSGLQAYEADPIEIGLEYDGYFSFVHPNKVQHITMTLRKA